VVLQFIEQMSGKDEEAPGPGRSAARQPLMVAALRVLARCAAALLVLLLLRNMCRCPEVPCVLLIEACI
jgi:hypothetical protein